MIKVYLNFKLLFVDHRHYNIFRLYFVHSGAIFGVIHFNYFNYYPFMHIATLPYVVVCGKNRSRPGYEYILSMVMLNIYMVHDQM